MGSWKSLRISQATTIEPKRVAQAGALYRIGLRGYSLRLMGPELEKYANSAAIKENFPHSKSPQSKTLFIFAANRFFAERNNAGKDLLPFQFARATGLAAAVMGPYAAMKDFLKLHFISSDGLSQSLKTGGIFESFNSLFGATVYYSKNTINALAHSARTHAIESLLLAAFGAALYYFSGKLLPRIRGEAVAATIELEKNLRMVAEIAGRKPA